MGVCHKFNWSVINLTDFPIWLYNSFVNCLPYKFNVIFLHQIMKPWTFCLLFNQTKHRQCTLNKQKNLLKKTRRMKIIASINLVFLQSYFYFFKTKTNPWLSDICDSHSQLNFLPSQHLSDFTKLFQSYFIFQNKN